MAATEDERYATRQKCCLVLKRLRTLTVQRVLADIFSLLNEVNRKRKRLDNVC